MSADITPELLAEIKRLDGEMLDTNKCLPAHASLRDMGPSALPALARRVEECEAEKRAAEQQIDEAVKALAGLEMLFPRSDENSVEKFERIAGAFYRDTGYLAPGKDCCLRSPEERRERYDQWIADKLSNARAALASLTPKEPT